MSGLVINVNDEEDLRKIIENIPSYWWISLNDRESILLDLYLKQRIDSSNNRLFF